MGVGKWIGSAMGFMTMGPLGALAPVILSVRGLTSRL